MWEKYRFRSALVTISTVVGRNMRNLKFLSVLSVYIVLLTLPSNGYVINEDGQLIPFKLYKKGMCFLHPRNCRGGFHKRELVGLTAPRESDNVYEVEVYKRQLTRQKKIPIPAPRRSELSQIRTPAGGFSAFSPWDDDIDMYQDDDQSSEERRYSFIDKKR